MTRGVAQESVLGRLARETRRAGWHAVRLSAQAAGVAAAGARLPDMRATAGRVVTRLRRASGPAWSRLPGLAHRRPARPAAAPPPREAAGQLVLDDRNRIAASLQDRVIYRVFGAGLTLQRAAALTTQDDVRRQIEAAVAELDQVIRVIRDTVFDLGPRSRGPDVRQDILDLCGQLSPPPEVSFSGPVATALPAQAGTRLLGIVRQALGLISEHATPARVDITAGPGAVTAVILAAAPLPATGAAVVSGAGAAMLRDRASQDGIQVDIQLAAGGGRLTCRVPIAAAR